MSLSGAGILHRLNPWTKVWIVLAVVLLAFLGPASSILPAALFVLVILPLGVGAGLGRPIANMSLRVALPTALVLLVVQGFFYPGAKTVLFQWGWLALKTEGLLYAWVTAARLWVMLTGISLLTLTTSPGDLMTELTQRGLPASLSYLVVSAIQIIPQMGDRASHIVAAQRARGLNTQGTFFNRLRGILPLVSPLIFGSLVDSEERAIALQARAFNSGHKPSSYTEIHDSPCQAAIRWLCIGLLIVGITSRFWL